MNATARAGPEQSQVAHMGYQLLQGSVIKQVTVAASIDMTLNGPVIFSFPCYVPAYYLKSNYVVKNNFKKQ